MKTASELRSTFSVLWIWIRMDLHSFWSAGSESVSPLGMLIRIQIQEGKNDPQKSEEIQVWKC
jgi:hypothetical protein